VSERLADRNPSSRHNAEPCPECARWLAWSGGRHPDDSPGDVVHAYSDGTIILDDGVTTWNPLRALAWIERRREANAERALEGER
jgi:hypothetical protein